MPINAKCPACGERFRRPDGLAGKLEKCPVCRHVFRLPGGISHSTAEEPPIEAAQAAPVEPRKVVPTPPAPPLQDDLPDLPPIETVEEPIAPVEVEETEELVVEADAVEDAQQVEIEADIFDVVEEQPPEEPEDEQDLVFAEGSESQDVQDAIFVESEELPDNVQDAAFGTSGETPKSVDYVMIAAVEVCADSTPGKVESELMKHGMTANEARMLMDDMVAIRKRMGDRKRRPGMAWIRLISGLLLMGVCGAAAWHIHAGKKLPELQYLTAMQLKYIAVGIAAVGFFFFLRGFWILISGGPKITPSTLAAARQKRE